MSKRKKFTPLQRNVVAARQKWQCAVCNDMLGPTFDLDHIKPLHEWRTYEYEQANDIDTNIQAVCVTCHRKKSSRETIARAKDFDFEKFRYQGKWKIEVFGP